MLIALPTGKLEDSREQTEVYYVNEENMILTDENGYYFKER